MIVDEEHGIAGDTEVLGIRLAAVTAGGWSQPPAKDTVAPLLEELALQRPTTTMVEIN
jgi:hypothetical protein